MVVVDDLGNVITNDIKGGNVIVKKFDGTDEELNAEIEKLAEKVKRMEMHDQGIKKLWYL